MGCLWSVTGPKPADRADRESNLLPGIGLLTFQAIQSNDTPVILGVVTVLTIVFLVSSLLVDILYAALDPRIRYE